MLELLNLGINDNELKKMLDLEPYIKDLTKDEIIKHIELLNQINCSNMQIINIISVNPTYLINSLNDILKLIKLLNNYGFNHLNFLFDANPFILNLDLYQIDNYINNKLKNGEIIEDIVDDLDSNPNLFNEM